MTVKPARELVSASALFLIVLTVMVFFGYTVGADMAERDNAADRGRERPGSQRVGG